MIVLKVFLIFPPLLGQVINVENYYYDNSTSRVRSRTSNTTYTLEFYQKYEENIRLGLENQKYYVYIMG